MKRSLFAIAAAMSAVVSSGGPGRAEDAASGSPLTKVAEFGHQVTGVAVTKDNRIFVNFPRWCGTAGATR